MRISNRLFFFLVFLPALSGCGKEAERPDESSFIRELNHFYFEAPNQTERIFASTYLGVKLVQNPADMWIMQELITETRPDFIIETGTFYGGAALYFATVLEQANIGGKVITVDISPLVEESFEALSSSPSLHESVRRIFDRYIEVITANSVDPQLIQALSERVKEKKVIVTLDSCHNYEHVLKELTLYAPLVSKGSYLIVQDTFLDDRPDWVRKYANCPGYKPNTGGPGRAVREFLRTNSDFTVDKSREKFLLTFYPSGYLKRIR